MTLRETYMKALRREPVERVTWAPNFDHWYSVNSVNNTMPAEYQGLSTNDIVRAVGGTIWRRVSILKTHYDKSVCIHGEWVNDRYITTFHSPVGDLCTVHQQAPDSSRALFLTEHRVKSIEDLRPLRYIIEATSYELDISSYAQQEGEVGDDGIVLTCLPAIPYIEFAKVDVGYGEAFYLMADYPDEVDAVLQAYQENFLQAYRLAAQSPCEVISNGDNMDQLTCPPRAFQQYAVPFYHQVRDILHAGGKLAQGHWCGQLDQLLHLIPGSGLDIIEAMTPAPMTKVDMRAAMELLEGHVTVQGGIPAVYMCDEGCSRIELARYIDTLLEQVGHSRGFILGMGDNIPPNADFPRVQLVSERVAEYNKRRQQVMP